MVVGFVLVAFEEPYDVRMVDFFQDIKLAFKVFEGFVCIIRLFKRFDSEDLLRVALQVGFLYDSCISFSDLVYDLVDLIDIFIGSARAPIRRLA